MKLKDMVGDQMGPRNGGPDSIMGILLVVIKRCGTNQWIGGLDVRKDA